MKEQAEAALTEKSSQREDGQPKANVESLSCANLAWLTARVDALQIACERLHGLISGFGILLQRLGKNSSEVCSGVSWNSYRLRPEQHCKYLGWGGTRQCRASLHQFVEYGGEAENFAPCIKFLAARLFRRHVSRGSHDVAGLCRVQGPFGAKLCNLRQAKIHDFDQAIGPQHDIFRLDITVQDAGSVGRLQGGSALNHHIESFLEGEVCPVAKRSRRVSPSINS